MVSTSKLLLLSLATFLVSGVIFFTVGWFSAPQESAFSEEDQAKVDLLDFLTEDRYSPSDISDLSLISTDVLRSNLSELSSAPHLAGKERDEALAIMIRDTLIAYGLDSVQMNPYEMLLSYPSSKDTNQIFILNSSDETIFESHPREDLSDDGVDISEEFVDAFLAYSPPGTAEGQIVYVNYGDIEDFELLTSDESSQYYTNVTGKICLVRYGKIFRGNKAKNAYDFGCTALVIFSDPADVAAEGTDSENVYPNTIWLPGSGIQRGTLFTGSGDPQTPLWPSIPNAYRVDEEELYKASETVPNIPCVPIGYNDAYQILSRLQGGDVPDKSWIGGFSNISYTPGGSFSCSECDRVKVAVHNTNQVVTANNVVGIIRGDVEPDRYVLVGNHRDAWGYGSIDPGSGTTQMLEVARVLGLKLRMENWRPRRTIVFLSWAAEEYGLVGSREFAEDFLPKLKERAVAYLNVDICSAGPILDAEASPTIQHKVLEATKLVPSPFDNSESYYDFWERWTQEIEGGSGPSIRLPGAGSDHASFIYLLGIPVVDLSFRDDWHIYPGLASTSYPAYHTAFETFRLVDEIVDPDFTLQQTCAALTLILTRQLSDVNLMDFRPEEYVRVMREGVQALKDGGQIDQLLDEDIDTQHWVEMIDRFEEATTLWRDRFESLRSAASSNPLLTRALNDQSSKVDRSLLLPFGLPNRPDSLHAIISPSEFNSYSSDAFPGISDLLYGFDQLVDGSDEKEERKQMLRKHVSDLMIVIKAAADYMEDISLVV